MAIEEGNYVQVLDRAATPADVKAGLFYNHFRGLAGRVDRVYADGAICVVVDHATLTRDMLARLKRAERVIKPRWKSGPGSEADAATATPNVPDAAAPDETGADEAGADETGDAEDVSIAETVAPDSEGAGGYTRPIPVTTAAAVVDDTGDLRVNPGLRYAIVLRPEDVQVTDASVRERTSPAGETAPVRASMEEIRAAEARQMQELLSRADRQKAG